MLTSSTFRKPAKSAAVCLRASLIAVALTAVSLPGVSAGKAARLGSASATPLGEWTRPGPSVEERAREASARLPLSFESNAGQTNSRVKFLARGDGYTLFLTPTEAVMSLRKVEVAAAQGAESDPSLTPRAALRSTASGVLRMKLVGANRTPEVAGEDELPGRVNYFNGSTPAMQQAGVSRYARVRYESVYPGIDMVYYGDQRQLEYDFEVEPGANPRSIQVAFQGVGEPEIDAQGGLVLHTAGGGVVLQHKPFIYQAAAEGRQAVEGKFVLRGGHRVGFEIGAYDRTKPLVIDPVLSYSTYLGGSGFEMPAGVSVDAAGNIYVMGETVSTNFPVSSNALQKVKAGGNQEGNGVDVFVTKLRPAGGGAADLIYSTYLGSSGNEFPTRMTSDAAGNAYIVGSGATADFPFTPNSFSQSPTGGFLVKLNPEGGLAYSTSIDGGPYYVALGPDDTVLVTGDTISSNFPFTPNAMLTTPLFTIPRGDRGGGFLERFKLAGSGKGDLLYSSYAHARRLAVDPKGNVYLGDNFTSEERPTTPNAIFTTHLKNNICFQSDQFGDVPCEDIYIQKLRPTSSGGYELAYGTWLGGKGLDTLTDIAADSQGFIYATGTTSSTPLTWVDGNSNVDDFPVTENAIQKKNNGNQDLFVTKIDPSSTSGGLAGLAYSTLFGGKGKDNPYAIKVGNDGSAYVAGETDSDDFVITANVLQAKFGGTLGNTISKPGGDGFVMKLNPVGSALTYSTYIGTSSGDGVRALAVGADGDAYITGYTWSGEFPTTANSFQPKLNTGTFTSGIDAFISKVSENRPPAQKAFAEGTGAFNVIDDSMSFVRQQYRDFLNREADDEGLRFWTNEITSCGADAQCREVKRVNVSAAFFLSIEFKETGYFFYRLHKAAFGSAPRLQDFRSAIQSIGKGVVVNAPGWQGKLAANRLAFVAGWAAQDKFATVYGGLTNEGFVDALFANTGVTPGKGERDALIGGLESGAETRASVLVKVADNEAFSRQELNPAFVLAEYFGYLQRDPDSGQDADLAGYNFWLKKLDEHGGNFVEAEMVKAFLDSSEYRKRFGPE